jgi:uncharacterized membrane protein
VASHATFLSLWPFCDLVIAIPGLEMMIIDNISLGNVEAFVMFSYILTWSLGREGLVSLLQLFF